MKTYTIVYKMDGMRLTWSHVEYTLIGAIIKFQAWTLQVYGREASDRTEIISVSLNQ